MSDLPIARRLTRPSPWRRQDPSRARDFTPTAKVNDRPSTPARKSNAGRTPRKTSIKNGRSTKSKKVTFSPDEADEADDEGARETTPTPSQRTSNATSSPSQGSQETSPPRSATSARHSASPATSYPEDDVTGSVSKSQRTRQSPTSRITPERSSSGGGRASTSSSGSSSSSGSVRTPPLNSPRQAVISPKTSKRPAEEDDRSSASKRRRSSGPFDSPSPEPEQQLSPEPEQQTSRNDQPRPGAENRKHFSIAQADEIFNIIVEVPRALDLGEMTVLSVRLQQKCQSFADRHFNFQLTAEQQAAWPLHALGVEYNSLLRITQYLADASHCGWRAFFTRPENRVPLIHGILGEWFRQRIFKIPGFGLSQAANEELAAIDLEYIDYDGIVRNKKRAECLERLTQQSEGFLGPAYFPDKYAQDVDIAATGLAGEIMRQIEPLLPPPVFDPLVSTTSWRSLGHAEKIRRDEIRHEIFMDLIDLIKFMAGLSISIRMAGRDGTIVRLAPHVVKGTQFFEDQRDDFLCVNGEYCLSTRPAQGPARLLMQMTCWSRLEAVVPHGPDRLELETFQRNQQRNLPEGQEFRWEDYEDQIFPIYPADLQETPEAAAAATAAITAAGGSQPPGTQWGAELAQWRSARVKEHKYQDDRDDDDNHDNNGAPRPERGSSVTFYPRVAPPIVYCAWVSDDDDVSRRPGATTQFPDLGVDRGDRPHETLREAVAAARRARGLYVRLQDLGITSINTLRYYRPLEWMTVLTLGGGLVGGALVAAHRQGLIPYLTRQRVVADCAEQGSNLAAYARHALGLSVAEARRLPGLLTDWVKRAPQMASSAVVQALTPAVSTITLTATVTDWTTVDGPTSTLTLSPTRFVAPDDPDYADYAMIQEDVNQALGRGRHQV